MLLQIAAVVSTMLMVVESSAKLEMLVGCGRRKNVYLSGIEMGEVYQTNLNRFKGAVCQNGLRRWRNSNQQVVVANWWVSFDTMGWALCPEGHFLIGIRRVTERTFETTEYGGMYLAAYMKTVEYKVFFKKEDQPLFHIEEGVCAKPADHPHHYRNCEHLDITHCYQKKGPCECKQGYHLAGVYREACNESECLTEFRCCAMMDEMDKLDGIDSVQTLIMDRTLYPLSYLAFYLGYGWCAGCRGKYVGDDFKRNGHTWEAVLSEFCEGYKHEERLKIDYLNWTYEKTNEKFGEMKREIMDVVTVEEKTIRNYNTNPHTSFLQRTRTEFQSVTHTTTNSWRNAHELGIEISFPFKHIAPKVNYKFTYENAQTVVDGTNNSSSSTSTTADTVTVPAKSEVEWKLQHYKIRVSIPYTVTVRAKFSTQFRGFLRWGQGKNSKTTNYHHVHRGIGDRPTFNYTFGDKHIPFYHALKQQSDRNAEPWLWVDLKHAYTSSQSMINQLTDEKNYEFNVTGWFTLYGIKVENEVSTPKQISRKRRFVNRPEIKAETEMSDINKVKTDMAGINNVKSDNADIIVKTDISDVNKMKTDMADVNKMKTDMADVNKMKTDMADVNKMKTDMADVNKMKTDMADVNKMKTDMADVNKMKTDMADVNRMKTDMADVNKMKTDMADVNKMKTDMADVNRMKTDMADVNKMKTDMVKNDVAKTALILDLLNTTIDAHACELPYLKFIDLDEKVDPEDI
ncbi:uncharacterized protein LOC131956561 [Physella acuta]|uniref:uncharacterized protein LOC131956561 n=1 Tax=Physella acuta TaxID=109671 RepID=UPI0027DD80E2|nr:uncharacterized protein LOC131956561 [Physella acuta]